MTVPSGTPRHHAAALLAAAALFLLLGVLLTAPLARHFTDGIPFTGAADPAAPVQHNIAGDHLQLYFRFWIFGDLLRGDSGPYRDRYQFSTVPGEERTFSSYFLPYPLIFALLRPWSPAAAYNGAVVASYLFAGLTVFLLLFRYTRDSVAATLGGAVFAAAPYRTHSVLAGHPLGFSAFLIPLVVWALERALAIRSRSAALGAGLAVALLADNDIHVLYLGTLLVPVFVLRHFLSRPPRQWPQEVRRLLAPGLLFALPSAAVLLLKLSLLSAVGSTDVPARSLREITSYTPVLAGALDRGNPVLPTYAYLGAAAALCALAGLVLAVRRRAASEDDRLLLRRMLFFALLCAGSYVLVFGPNFPVSSPYLFLYHHFPKFGLMRQTSKMMVVSMFALAVLAGLGAASLRRALPGARGLAACALALLAVVLDGSPLGRTGAGISLLPARVPAYEQAFAAHPGSRVVNVPIWPGDDSWSSHYLYYASLYRTVMVNGYRPVVPAGYQEQVFRPLAGLNAGQVMGGQHGLLRRMDIDYLIFHEESFPQKVCLFPAQYALDNLHASPYLAPVSGESPVWVFRVLPAPSRPPGVRDFPSSVVGVALPAWWAARGDTRDDAEASAGRALPVDGSARDFLLHRARTTPAGRFAFSVRLKPAGRVQLSLAAVRAADGAVLAERAFTEGAAGGYRILTLEYLLEESAPVYYLLRTSGGVGLALDWIHLRFADQEDPLGAFEFDEMYHFGNTRDHPRASGGRAVLLTAADPPGEVTRGPYRHFEPGRYVLAVSLAHAVDAAPAAGQPVAAVTVRNHLDESTRERDRPENVLLPERRVPASALAAPGEFREVEFPFTLERPTFLSVNVRHFGTPILLDRATLRRVGP